MSKLDDLLSKASKLKIENTRSPLDMPTLIEYDGKFLTMGELLQLRHDRRKAKGLE